MIAHVLENGMRGSVINNTRNNVLYVQIVATIHLHYTELLSALTRDGKSSMHSFLCILKKGLLQNVPIFNTSLFY